VANDEDVGATKAEAVLARATPLRKIFKVENFMMALFVDTDSKNYGNSEERLVRTGGFHRSLQHININSLCLSLCMYAVVSIRQASMHASMQASMIVACMMKHHARFDG